MYKWVDFPYKKEVESAGVNVKYLYAAGGFHSMDNGCPDWGTSNPKDIRFIGDTMGWIVIQYEDGVTDKVPLIFGYTLWFHSIWEEHPAPFFDRDGNTDMGELLKKTLCVQGAYECEAIGVLKIALQNKPVQSIYVEANEKKSGIPVYYGGYLTDGEYTGAFIGGKIEVQPGDVFYTDHTVQAEKPYPENYQKALGQMCHALHTFESDFEKAPEKFIFPSPAESYRIHFSGDRIAEIATGVIYHNMKNLEERTDDDGFIHTSYQDAPSWRYSGFGPYVPKANSYTHLFYSRDAARAIMTLNSFGHIAKAEAGCGFGNRWMMYYKEQGLTIRGVPVPGHFSVMPNDPMIYSKYLAPTAHWPTRYTEEEFGEGYQNLGNQETDGHGLMMMANYNVWINLGRQSDWVNKNWTYIEEAAEWIVWCFEHPDISFVQNNLLYGETEAALDLRTWQMGWTMYTNVPCCLGMMGYAEMAESVGRKDTADKWRMYAERIRIGINTDLTDEEGWNLSRCGFCHDPVPAMLSDFYGYDTEDMPADWLKRSVKSYNADAEDTVKFGWYGRGCGSWGGKGSGIGYDHSMITQNALLLDQMTDASNMIRGLSKLSYAPRLPDTYMVPEGISVDAVSGIFRRQGDLGNLVQLAEAMKCYLIVLGISPVISDKLKVMPRLPEGWSVQVSDFPLQNGKGTVNMQASYPSCGTQSITLSRNGNFKPLKTEIRFGPFPAIQKEADVYLNGKNYKIKLTSSGDSAWGWVRIEI